MRGLLHRWHRRIGIAAALFVLLLAITGILLNHTSRLDLDGRYIGSAWLLDWYDIQPDSAPVSYRAAGQRITRIGDRLYFNDRELAERSRELYGAVAWNGLLVAALDGELLVLTPAGRTVEILGGSEGVPAGLRDIGLNPGGDLVVQGAHGAYLADINTLKWIERDAVEADWSEPEPLPQDLQGRLLELYRGKGLSLERVLLDLHSGRLLGDVGVYLVDAAAVLFVVLGVSGLWMWLARPGRRRH